MSLSNAALNFQESAIRRIGALGATVPGLISLSAGYPAPDMFPWDDLQAITAQILARHDGNTAASLNAGTMTHTPRLSLGRTANS